jgi:hypothetical protein
VGDGDPDVGRFILDGKAASAMNPEDKAKAFIASFDGANAFSSSRFLEHSNPMSTKRLGGRSNRSAALIQPASARLASRRTSQYRRSPRSNVPPSISSGLPRDGRQPPG